MSAIEGTFADSGSNARRIIPAVAWLHVIMVAVGVGWVYFTAKEDQQVRSSSLPIYKKINGFTLERADGDPFSMLQMKGKVFIVSFVCVTCESGSRVVQRMAEMRGEFLAGDGRVRFLTISVDPESDTEESLRALQDTVSPAEDWYFLTGDRKYTYKLMKNNFMYAALQGSAGASTDATTAKLALVDQSGFLRGIYHTGIPEEMEQLRRDVEFLLK
jgi:cytochrome oxidase Cu insertion factor (SCO1/SenC/PrrC family)